MKDDRTRKRWWTSILLIVAGFVFMISVTTALTMLAATPGREVQTIIQIGDMTFWQFAKDTDG